MCPEGVPLVGQLLNTVKEGRWTSLKASFLVLEASARVSEGPLKDMLEIEVVRFMMDFRGFEVDVLASSESEKD